LSEHGTQVRTLLLGCLDAAIRRVQGDVAVSQYLEENPIEGRVHIVAVGKAACSMATGAMRSLPGQFTDVLVITKYEHLEPVCNDAHVRCIEAAHPVPDTSSMEAGAQLVRFIEQRSEDRFLFLISGGASSLVEQLPDGIGLEQLSELTQWLLGSGLSIQEMNSYRRALSEIKGGKLLNHLQHPERSLVLLISDVLGDQLEAIGSGLCFPVQDVVDRSSLPETIQSWWPDRAAQEMAAVPEHQIVASLDQAMEAAADYASTQGARVYLHRNPLSGDAADTGRALAEALINELPEGIHVWGGETTVMLPVSPGRGGRNQHMALSAAMAIEDREIVLLAAGTDGTDGPGEDAGGIVDGGTIKRGLEAGLSVSASQAEADSGSFLATSGDLVSTGPTGTNVMDLVIAWRGA
jgi:glycerate 2-kinase